MDASTEEWINELIGRMTIEEKIGQLNQPEQGESINPEEIRLGRVGSLIKAAGALTGKGSSFSPGVELANRLQQLAMDSRLKIPLIIGRDVIHGCRTIFPIPLAQAASFDPELAEKAAAVAAHEASACGIKWTFAPMLDIARDPRWGRVAEGNGEDPFLGAQMASSLVKGYQGEDISSDKKLVACAKHYVGYGSAEGGRDYENGEISEPTLRDIYLPPFESAVRAGVGTVMSAFLDLNGIPATANHHLLSEVLRGEWGFDGFVVSDWASVAELVNHGVAADRAEAATIALRAGVDMDMCSNSYMDFMAGNLQNGSVAIDEIDEAVRRVLRIKHRAGLFSQPFTDPARAQRELLAPAARKLARQFARECLVLLKNQDNVLPLSGFRKILVAGDFIHARSELYGTWSPDGVAEDCTPFDRAFTEVSPKNTELWFAEDHDQALDQALEAEAIILLLGELPSRSGENANLSDLSLPADQARLVDAMVTLGKPVILVVFAGRPLVLTRQVQQADAVLFAWHPGIEGAAALGEVIFGSASPGGRLPITFPRATGQVPIYYNHKNSGRPVTPGGWFNSRYVDLPSSPLFPFGFGLSYTNFDYRNMQLSGDMRHGNLSVRAEVTNSGEHAGTELVQLYMRDLVGSLTRPIRQLKGFQRVELKPGETRRVTFEVTEEMLAFSRADGTFGAEPGAFQVWIAPDSVSGLRAEFQL